MLLLETILKSQKCEYPKDAPSLSPATTLKLKQNRNLHIVGRRSRKYRIKCSTSGGIVRHPNYLSLLVGSYGWELAFQVRSKGPSNGANHPAVLVRIWAGEPLLCRALAMSASPYCAHVTAARRFIRAVTPPHERRFE